MLKQDMVSFEVKNKKKWEQFLFQKDRTNGTHKKTVFSLLCLVMGTNGKEFLCSKVLLSSFFLLVSHHSLWSQNSLSVSHSEYVIFIFVWN